MLPDGKTDYEHQLESANKLAKKHPFDCGKANCLMCHGPKIHKKWDPKKNKYKTAMLEDYNEF